MLSLQWCNVSVSVIDVYVVNIANSIICRSCTCNRNGFVPCWIYFRYILTVKCISAEIIILSHNSCNITIICAIASYFISGDIIVSAATVDIVTIGVIASLVLLFCTIMR